MSPYDLEHRARCLDRGNWVRSRRKEFRAKLKTQAADQRLKLVVEVVTDVPPWAKNVEVGDFLIWIPEVGPYKRDRMLRRIGLNPIRRLGYLHDSTKIRLLRELA